MRVMRCAWLLLLVSSACAGDAPANVDANPLGPMCSKLLYDLCSEEHDCTSGNCHNFMNEGFQVCTQTCNDQAPCPADRNGTPGECNAMGICKPSAANMCHL